MATKQNIKPLFDYVLIRPLQREDVTESGIVLPDTVFTRAGTILSILVRQLEWRKSMFDKIEPKLTGFLQEILLYVLYLFYML